MTDSTSLQKCRRLLPYQVLDGAKVPLRFDLQKVRDATRYVPKEGDLFIVSYPKCGTTWVQYIVYLLCRDTESPDDASSLITRIPFVERDGFPEEREKIFAFKYHLPPEMIPFSSKAKYICVTRNVRDAVVSYYHFFKSIPCYLSNDISFDDCLESFLSGDCLYGDYFEHLVAWYERRNDPNVLFLTYESMKKDHKGSILKIAHFIGKDLTGTGERLLEDVLKYSHVSYMKDKIGTALNNYVYDGPLTTFPGILNQHETIGKMETQSEMKSAITMVRKGKIGDWKDHFTKEQKERTIAQFLKKTQPTDVYTLWPEIFGSPEV